MYTVIFVVIFAVCFYILGYAFGRRHYTSHTVGDLRVDQSDEDGPYLFLELSEPVTKLIRRNYVVLKVNLKNYISQD